MLRLTHYTTCHGCDGTMRPPGTSADDHPGTLAYRAGGECNTCAARRRRNDRDPHVKAMRSSLEYFHQWRRDNGHSHPAEERLWRLQARRDEDNRLIALLDEQNRAIRAGELFAKHPTLPGPTDPEQVRHGAVASMTVEFYNQGPERLREATAEVLQGQHVGNRKRNRHGLGMTDNEKDQAA